MSLSDKRAAFTALAVWAVTHLLPLAALVVGNRPEGLIAFAFFDLLMLCGFGAWRLSSRIFKEEE